ncbi:MAG: polysaccharide biosynthesis tyrosine autokinase [Planctomycetaceae bacterium]|nr:MAG: polysaccharide biosynthesis tyrosine autokinase [Planctomycetaceae bacterium]
MMQHEQHSSADESMLPSSADSIHALIRFLQVVYHRKIYVVSAVVVASLLGGLYYTTATPIYQATSQLLILSTGPDILSPTLTAESSRQALIPTYERLFTTQEVLEGAIESLLQGPAENRIDFASAPRHRWANILRGNLSAQAIRRTNVIEISYKSRSPGAAEAVVGAVVQSYLEFMERSHKDVSTEIVQILDRERLEIEGRLSTKQEEILDVQRRLRDLGLSGNQNVVHPAVQRVIRLNETLLKVQQDRLQLEASLWAIRTAIRDGNDLRQHLTAIEPLIGRELTMSVMGLNSKDMETRAQIERRLMEDQTRLESLQQHYGRAHPKVIELMQQIQAGRQYLMNYQEMVNQRLAGLSDGRLGPMLLARVEEQLSNLREHEERLDLQYEQAESEAVMLNDRMAEMKMIEHDLARMRNLHDTLLNRIANIDIGHSRSDVRVAVVSEPKASDRPVSPKLPLVAMLCLVGGLGIGLALVYVIDVLDDRFRSPEELQQQLGAPVLAMIRELATPATAGLQAIQVHVSPESVESEAFRTLRTTLAFSGSDLERIAITSTEPSDGKTTVLANLAVSYAHSGKRTLVIDADLRRPGMTKLFEMRSNGGLSEILRGDSPIDAMCRPRVLPSGIAHLDVMPCGPKPSNPAELLSGPRLADVLAWAEANYDQVLIDCPPILAAADAAIIGRLTEGLIVVIQPEKNHRRLVLRAIAGMSSMGVGLIGIVANRIRHESGGGYFGYGGYGYGYGYGYRDGYGQPADEARIDQDRFASGETDWSDEEDSDVPPGAPHPRNAA